MEHEQAPAPEGAFGYPAGRLRVKFLVEGRLVEIRLVDDLISTAVSAARSLKARFLFKGYPCETAPSYTEWYAYDTATMKQVRGKDASITPVRVFFLPRDDETLDAPVMWALARQARID